MGGRGRREAQWKKIWHSGIRPTDLLYLLRVYSCANNSPPVFLEKKCIYVCKPKTMKCQKKQKVVFKKHKILGFLMINKGCIKLNPRSDREIQTVKAYADCQDI